MTKYTYKAKKGPTEIVEGEIEADSKDRAVKRLDEMGLVPVRVLEKGSSGELPSKPTRLKKIQGGSDARRAPSRPVRRGDDKPANRLTIKTRDIDSFTRQLSSLVKASVPILRALSLIAQQTESKPLKSLVTDLERQIRDGKILSEAMRSYPRVFNNLYLNIVRSGEKGGVLNEALLRLTEHRQREEDTRHKVQAACAYPILLIVVGVGTIFVMLTYFLPKLMVVFDSMKQNLPMPTRILMAISGFTSSNWAWLLIGIVVIAVMFTRIKQGSKKKLLFDSFKLKVPFVRKFIGDVEVIKFSRTLGLLLKNGIPIYESLELATNTLDNEAMKGPLKRASKQIIVQGSTLSASLKQTGVFPAFAINMITVGEEGGTLEEALSEVAGSYQRELDQAIKIMSSLLEPVLILTVGSVVGFIVFAMLLPIFDIGVIGK